MCVWIAVSSIFNKTKLGGCTQKVTGPFSLPPSRGAAHQGDRGTEGRRVFEFRLQHLGAGWPGMWDLAFAGL